MDTFVVRLVLATTVLAWGSVLLHDLVTPDAPEESLAPAAARGAGTGDEDATAPSFLPATPGNASATPPRPTPGGPG